MITLSSSGAGTRVSEENRTIVDVFRNRPGDSMRDKYNLNTLPPGHEEEYGNLGECVADDFGQNKEVFYIDSKHL